MKPQLNTATLPTTQHLPDAPLPCIPWLRDRRDHRDLRGETASSRSRFPRRALAFACFASFVASLSASSQSIPPLINYQGRVADAEGRPFTGTTNLSFSVYTNATVGSAVWGPQTFTNAQVVGGFFNVVLGQDDNARAVTGVFTNASTWVETVCGTRTNVPRQQILSVPYAAQAATATRLNGSANLSPSGSFNGTFSTSVDAMTTVPGCQTSILCSGRPILVAVNADFMYNSSGPAAELHLYRGSTYVGAWTSATSRAPISCTTIDVPPSGTNAVYSIYIRAAGGAGTTYIYNPRIRAVEL